MHILNKKKKVLFLFYSTEPWSNIAPHTVDHKNYSQMYIILFSFTKSNTIFSHGGHIESHIRTKWENVQGDHLLVILPKFTSNWFLNILIFFNFSYQYQKLLHPASVVIETGSVMKWENWQRTSQHIISSNYHCKWSRVSTAWL